MQDHSAVSWLVCGGVWGVTWGYVSALSQHVWGTKNSKQCSDGTLPRWVVLAPQTAINMQGRKLTICDVFTLLYGDILCYNQPLFISWIGCIRGQFTVSKWHYLTAARATPTHNNPTTLLGSVANARQRCFWCSFIAEVVITFELKSSDFVSRV
jgi:hypothetical protein